MPAQPLEYAPPDRRGWYEWLVNEGKRLLWRSRLGMRVVRAGQKTVNLAHFVAAEMSPPGEPPRLVVLLEGGHRVQFEGEDAERIWAAVRAVATDVRTELRVP